MRSSMENGRGPFSDSGSAAAPVLGRAEEAACAAFSDNGTAFSHRIDGSLQSL